jgi:hypothetical protein
MAPQFASAMTEVRNPAEIVRVLLLKVVTLLLHVIDIQLGRLTPMPELPRSGRMNLGRRFNAGAGTHHPLRHVVTPEFNRRYATQRSC